MWTTPIKVCTSSRIYFYLFIFGAGCIQNHRLKKCCKGPNRATGLCEQSGGLRPCSCSWAFCLPRNKCRELLKTLWLVGFSLFYFFRVSPCVLWISVGKVGHYINDPSLINYCCFPTQEGSVLKCNGINIAGKQLKGESSLAKTQ